MLETILKVFFREMIFLYHKDKGIFYQNEAVNSFVQKHSEGDLNYFLHQFKDYYDSETSLFDEIQKIQENQISQEGSFCVKKFRFISRNQENVMNLKRNDSINQIFEARILDCAKIFEKGTILVNLSNVTKKIQYEQAQLVSQNKNILLCSVSHEIRTPLHQIFGKPDFISTS